MIGVREAAGPSVGPALAGGPRFVRDLLATAREGKIADCWKAVDALDALPADWLPTAKIRILRNFAIEPLAPWLKLAGYHRELKLFPHFGGYGTYLQELLESSSGGGASAFDGLDALVVALWLELMPMAWNADGELDAGAAFDHLTATVERALQSTRALVVVNTFLPPIGSGASWSQWDALDALNLRIRSWVAQEPRLALVDVARLGASLGQDQAVDGRFGFSNRAPASPELLRAWGNRLGQLVAASKGRARKVLVLDADQTLWGGVIGEDGVEGIQLDPNEYPGNTFVAFQKQVLALHRQGVVLALCSKNEEADVVDVLANHPHCLLRPRHFASIRVNWKNKAENLGSIAEELRLGLESFVFIDDSAVECGLVRQALPMVDVLHVPAGSARLSTLARYDGFEGLRLTVEDGKRAELYRAEQARGIANRQFDDVPTFLASLDLEATVGVPSAAEVARVAQLSQKTNQFNLTTRRYSVGEVQALMEDSEKIVVRLSARDRYGDLGLVGVGISSHQDGRCRIDALLLSCRALGRELETVLLMELVTRSRDRWGPCEVVGEYVPSPKNAQVREFFLQRGFGASQTLGMRECFSLPATSEAPVLPAFIRVVRR